MLTGRYVPLISRFIVPCDADGVPSADENLETDQFETKAVIFAWFGRYMSFAYGEVTPRAVDPKNPKRFLPGDMEQTFV